MAPAIVPPTAEAMASSVLLRGGGGLDGGMGFFFFSPNKDGRDSLGKLGKSMMDRETSSERSLTDGDNFLVVVIGGGMSTVGDFEAKGLEMVIVGVRLGSDCSFVLGTAEVAAAAGFSGSGGGGANLSLNPGMKRPVVVASVSNSGSPSSSSLSLAAADRQLFPRRRLLLLTRHRTP